LQSKTKDYKFDKAIFEMVSREEWAREDRKVYERMKAHKEVYSVDVNGVKVYIFPDVFSPAYFTDSKWFSEKVPQIVGKGSLLEIGTGTGIIALFAALNGAEVTATDINKQAVENARYNFQKHGVNAKLLFGDIYEPLSKEDKFDFIFWNHPFNYGTKSDEEILLKSGFDFNYKSLEKYISGADTHLTKNGRLLLGTGSSAALSKIKKIATRYSYKMKLLVKEKMPLYFGCSLASDYRIYKFVKD
jgi:methylase of polypeptide subunit release factors